MSLPLNKTIAITHIGAGIVTFPVPFLSPTSTEPLRLQLKISKQQQGDQILQTPLRLEILKIIGNLQNVLKKNGSFYVRLLQEGFLQNGAITLIGLMPTNEPASSSLKTESKKIFKAVIQLDGDIICQIDRDVLKEKHADELIRGYTTIQNQFLEGFRKILRAIRQLIFTSLAILIAVLYFTWKSL